MTFDSLTFVMTVMTVIPYYLLISITYEFITCDDDEKVLFNIIRVIIHHRQMMTTTGCVYSVFSPFSRPISSRI